MREPCIREFAGLADRRSRRPVRRARGGPRQRRIPGRFGPPRPAPAFVRAGACRLTSELPGGCSDVMRVSTSSLVSPNQKRRTPALTRLYEQVSGGRVREVR